VDVYGAHLKSGEGAADEARRIAQLKPLLAALSGGEKDRLVVLAMDSNNSELYEAGMPKGPGADKKGNKFNLESFMSEAIADAGCVDLVKTHDSKSECFKMRHARGGQPKKFGQLMFDSIDKIVVRSDTRVQPSSPVVLKSFTKIRDADFAGMREWRTNETKRAAIKTACLGEKWGDNMEENTVPASLAKALSLPAADVKGVFMQLYPNSNAPSDHPPCISPAITLGPKTKPSIVPNRFLLSLLLALAAAYLLRKFT